IAHSIFIEVVTRVITPIITIEFIVVQIAVVRNIKGIIKKIIELKNVSIASPAHLYRPPVAPEIIVLIVDAVAAFQMDSDGVFLKKVSGNFSIVYFFQKQSEGSGAPVFPE